MIGQFQPIGQPLALPMPASCAAPQPPLPAEGSVADDRLYRHLVESVRDYAIFMLNPQGVISSWNLGAERLKLYRADEIIGRHFSVFYPAEQVQAGWPAEELRRATQEGRFEDEGWRIRRDGTRFWANVVITAIRDQAGALIGFSKVTRDLTERRQHEHELREREESLRLIVEGVRGHALFLLTPEGRVQSWNAGAQRLLGHRASDIVGQPIDLLYRPAERACGAPQADLTTALQLGHAKTLGWRQKADGQALWVEVTTTALHTPEGSLRGLVQIVRDLTDQARLKEMEAEGQRLHHFIAMLSHELRNPLGPLQTAARLIQAGEDLPRQSDVITRQTAHLTRLVDDLLDVSRIATGKIQLTLHPLDLRTVVRRAVETAHQTFERKGQTLTPQWPDRTVPVLGDETRLTQVIDNLLNNAGKFTDVGGHIELRLSIDGAHAVLEVSDNGVGMPAALLTAAFDPFVQGESTVARSQGGLGIGLALVKRIVELHEGQVTARSGGVGTGACFSIRLPLTQAALPVEPVAASPSETADPSAADQHPRRVLIVDDNRDAAESLAALLELEGFDVRTVHDGPQALATARAWRPDSVVLDIGLPGMDGYQVAAALRDAFAGQPMQLLAVTGYGQTSDRERTRQAGFDLHLVKPVDHDELTAALRLAR